MGTPKTKKRKSSRKRALAKPIEENEAPMDEAICQRLHEQRLLGAYWMEQTGRPHFCIRTLATVYSYVAVVGLELVLQWIDKAAVKTWNDRDAGRYVSGCLRQHRLAKEAAEEGGIG